MGLSYVTARSRRLHGAVASRLLAHPASVLEKAHANLAVMRAASPSSEAYLFGWEQLLGRPVREIAERLVEVSEEMDELRQNTVFAGVLSPTVRWDIYRAHRAEWVSTGAP